MLALESACRAHQATQLGVLLEERDGVAALGCDAGCLHAAHAAAHDDDLLGHLGSGQLVALGHRIGVRELRHGVHAAVLGTLVAGIEGVAALVVAM